MAEPAVPRASEGPATGRGYGRLIDVLELIARREEPITLSELARVARIPKATTTLLVQHLVARGYLQILEDRSFLIGPQYLRLGAIVAGRATGRGSARVIIREAARLSGLDTCLGILSGQDVVLVDRAEGRGMVQFDPDLGAPQPLHCTAAGKAALAFGPDRLWEAVEASPLERYTDRTIVDPELLRADVGHWRSQGFAVSAGERLEGLVSVAVPVNDAHGVDRILAVLGHQQATTHRLGEIVTLLQEAADRLATGSGAPAAARGTQQ